MNCHDASWTINHSVQVNAYCKLQVSDSVHPFWSRLHHYVINNLNFHAIDFDLFADQSVKYNVQATNWYPASL